MIITQLYQRYHQSTELTAGFWYLVSVFVQRGITFLAVPLFVNILTTNEFGLVSIFSSWVALLSAIFTLNVQSTVIRAKFDFQGPEYKQFLSSIMGLGLLGCLVGVVIFSLLPNAVSLSLFGLSTRTMLLVVVNSATLLPIAIALNNWRARYEYRFHGWLSVLIVLGEIGFSLLFILTIPFFVPSFNKGIGRILGLTLINSIFGIYFFIRRLNYGRTLFHRQYWIYAVSISLPLIIHTVSTVLLSRFDQLMIDQYIGRSETGIYSLAYNIGSITNMILFATNSVWSVWFLTQMNEENHLLIQRRARQYLFGFTGVIVILILLGPFMIRIIAPPSYREASSIVPVVIAGGYFVFLYSFYVGVEFYWKRTGLIATATLMAAVVNIGLNMLLIPTLGYQIAAWTTLISYACMFLFHSVVVVFWLKQGYLFQFWLLGSSGVGMSLLAYLMFTFSIK